MNRQGGNCKKPKKKKKKKLIDYAVSYCTDLQSAFLFIWFLRSWFIFKETKQHIKYF